MSHRVVGTGYTASSVVTAGDEQAICIQTDAWRTHIYTQARSAFRNPREPDCLLCGTETRFTGSVRKVTVNPDQ